MPSKSKKAVVTVKGTAVAVIAHDEPISLPHRRFEALVADNCKLRSPAKKCDKALSVLLGEQADTQN